MDTELNRFAEYKEIVQLIMDEFPGSLVTYTNTKSSFECGKYSITIERKMSNNVDYPMPSIYCSVSKNGVYCLNMNVDIDIMASYLNQEANHTEDYSQYKIHKLFKSWNRYN